MGLAWLARNTCKAVSMPVAEYSGVGLGLDTQLPISSGADKSAPNNDARMKIYRN